MFELPLIGNEEKMYVIDKRCINCKKKTGLFLIYSKFEEMTTKFVLNTI